MAHGPLVPFPDKTNLTGGPELNIIILQTVALTNIVRVFRVSFWLLKKHFH